MLRLLKQKANSFLVKLREAPLNPGEKMPPLDQLAKRVQRLNCKHNFDAIQGWLSFDECRALYALGFYLPDPFLEIGPWIGRSTTCIALGIRDSGVAKSLVSCELNPTLKNFRPLGNGVGFYVPEDGVECLGEMSLHDYKTGFEPILTQPGRAIGVLERNLTAQGLRDKVKIIEGDFRSAPRKKYRFIFSDCLHNAAEIDQNAPALRSFMEPGSIIACHDTYAGNEMRLKMHIPIGVSCMIDSLFIGEVIAN